MSSLRFLLAFALVLGSAIEAAPQRGKPGPPATSKPTPAQPDFFTTPLTLEQMKNKQAVVETDLGTMVIDLLPEAAPNHVGYFIKLAQEGAYNGSIFHRVVRQGVIQGGDPITRDPAKQAQYGTGGLGVLKAERNAERHTRGAVSTMLAGGNPDSGGSQFFICIVAQPGLDGVHDVFGRVSEGLLAAQKISEAMTDASGRPVERIAIRSVTVRDKPAPTPEPFSTQTVPELSSYRAVLETSLGDIAVEFLPAQAPNHVRNFLRLAQAGVYDGMAFHRVARGFVIQTGYVASRSAPLNESQQRFVRTLQPEFNDTVHVKGTLSMARGDDPASASTSFFISTARSAALDGKYTAFGQVVDGLSVVDAIEAVPVNGETPIQRVDVKRVRVERKP